jgi:hypothetical protein
MGTPEDDSFDAKLNAIAEQISKSIERAAENLDLSELAERFGIDAERASELAGMAGHWIRAQAQATSAAAPPAEAGPREGPHPLDVPTEAQGLALSALDSGRWKVDPGTEELVPVGGGPGPSQPIGLVGELRARDWIAPDGGVTLVGHDALKRWLAASPRPAE